jgi:transposase InsO family protein
LPRVPGGFRFLFIVIDTFTKWIEAMPVANIMQEVAVKFLQSIIYRFGIPRRVLTDNRTQFKGAKFVRYCIDFGIHHQQHILRLTGKSNEQTGLFYKG